MGLDDRMNHRPLVRDPLGPTTNKYRLWNRLWVRDRNIKVRQMKSFKSTEPLSVLGYVQWEFLCIYPQNCDISWGVEGFYFLQKKRSNTTVEGEKEQEYGRLMHSYLITFVVRFSLSKIFGSCNLGLKCETFVMVLTWLRNSLCEHVFLLLKNRICCFSLASLVKPRWQDS